MIDISEIWKYNLRKGKTDHPANGACLFDAGMWLVYGKIGDDPPCSCPVIRAYAIGLNDRMDDKTRQMLKPFILRVVGNRDPEAKPARLRHIVLETARRVVPLAVDLRPDVAADLRAIPDDIDYKDLCDRLRAAAAAATAADYAADAAAAAPRRAVVWRTTTDILDGALRIGKQSPEFDEQEVIAAVEQFEMARRERVSAG